jgi:hypothetical protein
VLWKKEQRGLLTTDEVGEILDAILDLPIEFLGHRDLLAGAMAMAREFSLTVILLHPGHQEVQDPQSRHQSLDAPGRPEVQVAPLRDGHLLVAGRCLRRLQRSVGAAAGFGRGLIVFIVIW